MQELTKVIIKSTVKHISYGVLYGVGIKFISALHGANKELKRLQKEDSRGKHAL